MRTTTHIGTVRTRKGTDHLKHLLPPVSQQTSGSGGYDTEPASKGYGNIDVTAFAETSEEPKPQGTRFKVVSPKDKISPQQVHEKNLSPCVDFNRRT